MKQLFSLLILISLFFTATSQNYNVTSEEALAAGKILEKEVFDGKPTAISNLLDNNSFLNNIEKKSEAAKEKGFMKGFAGSFNLVSFSDNLVETLKKGTYRVVNTYEKEGKRHLLLRMFGQQGLNYHDYSLIKIGNTVKADDIHILVTGEELSATFANLIDASVNSSKSLNDLSGKMKTLVQLKKLKTDGNYEEIIKIIDGSDKWMKENKAVQMHYLEAKKNISNDAYKKALLDYQKLFPDEANVYLWSIDVYFLEEDYEKTQQAINKLDSIVGKDIFLNYMRGNIYSHQQKMDEAESAYFKAFEYDHACGYSLSQVVNVYMAKDDSAHAKESISQYQASGYARNEIIDQIYFSYPSLK